MIKFKQVKNQVGQVSSKPTWSYNEIKIDEDNVVYIRTELWDNAPDLKPLFEKKRYRAAVNLYYNKPETMEAIKEPDHRLWSYMSNFHTFRNNQYKDATDPHSKWYANAVANSKELVETFGTNSVVTHGCLGAVKNHNGNNGGYGPHNQPRYTVDVLHSTDNPDVPVMILHIKDQDYEIALRKQPQKNNSRALYSGELA